MLRIIDKYIFREIFNTWLIVMLTLLAVLLTNQFARILGDVAKDKLPKDSVMDLILLSGLQYLTILIPIGLFLSILEWRLDKKFQRSISAISRNRNIEIATSP